MLTEKDIEIAVLKGELAAMERRLCQVLAENKQLKAEAAAVSEPNGKKA